MSLGMRIKRILLIMLGIYIGLFLCFLAYDFYKNPRLTTSESWQLEYYDNNPVPAQTKKNYASITYAAPAKAPSISAMVEHTPSENTFSNKQKGEQKFEKTASINASSRAFNEDEKKIRNLISEQKAIIQDEQTLGRKSSRRLHLIIGVTPASFDTFYEAAQKIGTVRSVSTEKQDRTNHFLTLKAKRASLESTKASLVELKKHEGKIEDFIKLQNRILEVEQELQTLGVSLGEFDEINAFFTVRFSLTEEQLVIHHPTSIITRAIEAFLYATGVFTAGLSLFFFATLTAFILLLAIDRFKLIQKFVNYPEQTKK
ncbi:DUF4349 domain-containing protein [Desulfovibrio litoralis]|uniref:DUF4349 domain-containing protein n=1 Tax=Desulfovibrio litoralis DSM 11393 TaxID=1121455 RepID=A0A1M7RRK3_9BACT|nr:DUF4349 domain-containing protein [Desulfovibrio litoralis]SHN48879.1 protein of unknown function [Desulfovibrio litoralis DSM 11393]